MMKIDRNSWMRMLTVTIFLAAILGVTGRAYAEHEVDHRYRIWGQVRDSNGAPAAGMQVHVTARGGRPLGESATDAEGMYRFDLHVHNDNLGQVFYVTAPGMSAEGQFKFDPNDLTTERIHRLDLAP